MYTTPTVDAESHLASRKKINTGARQSSEFHLCLHLFLKLTMAARKSALALAAVLLPSSAQGASLIASHFSGNLYSLTLSESGELTVDSEVSSGNFWPSWLDLDSESGTLYVPDESDWSPPNGLVTFTVGADGSLTPGDADSQTATAGGEVHSTLYGGQDGKGFIAFAH